MKILMLGWELPPYNSGGLGVACYQICRELSLQGVDIDFVLPHKYPAKDGQGFMTIYSTSDLTGQQTIKLDGAYDSYCYACSDNDCVHFPATDLRERQQDYVDFIEELVVSNSYDAIHAHDWLTLEAGVRAKERTGIPLIAHVHSTEFDRSGQNEGNPLVHEIEYNCLIMADKIISVSQITKDIIVKNYQIPASKVEVVHNGIHTQHLAKLDTLNSYIYLQKMKSLGYTVVVSIGRLTVQKGLNYLLEAAKKVLEHDSKVLFLIVGDGEQREELIKLAAEHGVSQNIIMTGFLRGKQWRDAYAIGDIFVMSSVSEPFGLTALEAASCNNAILLSRQSGVGEILKNVMRFDYWDTNRLADEIVNIAQSEPLQQVMAQNVNKEVGRLSWQEVANKIICLYDEAAKGVKV